MTEAQRAVYVAALYQEREGYVRFGKSERVIAVNAELVRLGEKVEPTRSNPRGRRAAKPTPAPNEQD